MKYDAKKLCDEAGVDFEELDLQYDSSRLFGNLLKLPRKIAIDILSLQSEMEICSHGGFGKAYAKAIISARKKHKTE